MKATAQRLPAPIFAFWIAAGLAIAAIGVAYWVIEPEEVAAEQFAGEGAEELPAAEAAYSEAA